MNLPATLPNCCFNYLSWHRVAAISVLFASLIIIYTFFLPLFPVSPPSLNFDFSSSDSRSVTLPPDSLPFSNRSSSFTIENDINGPVFFRNAPWKPDVGNWLSRCFNNSLPFAVVETISNRPCPNNCSQRGICNRATGQCRCFHGYGGVGCEKLLDFECNQEALPGWPYGRWMVSICSAHCDKTRAMCFCGNGTKYPERPVAEACGFVPKGELVDWAKPDRDNIFANESSKKGWCNVDPFDGYHKKSRFKEQCDCKYDCTGGRFCETTTQCVCINQCSGSGVCSGGFCQCKEGWYGVDCSIPSAQINQLSWPNWLSPNRVQIPDVSEYEGIGKNTLAVVQKKRPLIYVYDLPPEFNSHLLEGRHWKFECVNRIYDDTNSTVWTDQLYGAEIALYESLLASPHRTTNGDEADFFYVPVMGACLITRADDAPHMSMKNHMGFRSYLTLDFYRRAYFHISESYPYWNRSAGRDHIWFFSWDEGACCAPKEIWNSMMVVHWGNTNSRYNYSTTEYFPDNWDHIPPEERGNHPCFDPEKDVVLPAWKIPDAHLTASKLWERPRSKRKTLFYFNGNLGNAYNHGRPEPRYSMGIRQKLASEFGSSPNKEGKLGRQATQDVIVTNIRSAHYSDDLASSKFCGVFPGDGWSGRMEDSILHGCIPVIIQDGIQLAYENLLEYNTFSIRIKEEDIPQLVHILQAVNETELDYKLTTIQHIWQRFLYSDSIVLEAQRQQKEYKKDSSWAQESLSLINDDAFTTFIQVLHYKLYNDAWRLEVSDQQRQSTLPRNCKRTKD